MPRIKLTKTAVDSLPFAPLGKSVFYVDAVLPGFGLRVSSSVKSYFAEKRVAGKTVRVSLGRHNHVSCEQARRLAQRRLGEMAEGLNPNAERRAERARRVTLRVAFNEYLKARSSLKPSSVRHNRDSMRLSFADWMDRPITAITKDAVAARHQTIGKERGHATANLSMRVLRAVLNFARVKYEDAGGRSLLPENPVSRLTQTRAWFPEVRRRGVIRDDDFPKWFRAVQDLGLDGTYKGPVVRDFLLLVLFTGVRREEAARLRWQHVDLKARVLTIPDTKNGEPLTLPLSVFVTELLARRRDAGVVGYVFPGEGASGHIVEPKRQLDKVRRASGVEFIIHDLRRTFVTVADSLDISAFALKRLVNHKVSGDVTDGYIVHSVERLREPVERIAVRMLQLAQCDDAITGLAPR